MDRREFIGTATGGLIALTPVANALGAPLQVADTDALTLLSAGPITFHDPGDTSGFVAVLTSTNDFEFSPQMPAEFLPGDWLVCAIYQRTADGVVTPLTPGWSLLAAATGTNRKLSVYVRKAISPREDPAVFVSKTHSIGQLIEAQIFRLTGVPVTSIVSAGPTPHNDGNANASVDHLALTPADDDEAVCIFVCKRDAHTTGPASKPGFTELFTVTNPSGTGQGRGTLACVYQVQTTATPVPGGTANPVLLPGESNVGSSIILSFKKAPTVVSWAAHTPQSWKTPLPGTYIEGMRVYDGMNEAEHWLYFTGRMPSDYTSTDDDTGSNYNSDLKVAFGTCRAAAAFANTVGNGGVTVIDLGAGCHAVSPGLTPTGDYKHWTGAWSAGPLVYRSMKFQPNGNRQMYDNFVVMVGDDDTAGPGWDNRDCWSTAGTNGQFSYHFLHNLFLFTASDECLENWRAANEQCVLYCIIGPPLQASSHNGANTGVHGFGMLTRGTHQQTHRNVFWGSQNRNPLTTVYRQSIVNNLIFNYWRNAWQTTGTTIQGIAFHKDADPMHGKLLRQYNVVGNLFVRGRMTGNEQSDMHYAIRGGHDDVPIDCHVDLNHTFGFTPPVDQQHFLWDSTESYAATKRGEAWSDAWGANKESVFSFGSSIGLTQDEALAAADLFRASCGSRPGAADRFDYELRFFEYLRNAVVGSGEQMEIYNSVAGTNPNSGTAWTPGSLYRMLPNVGGYPTFIPWATNWQGSIAATLDHLGIATLSVDRNTPLTSGTFSDGVTSCVGYTQFQVAHIERKWAVGNPKPV